MEKANNHKDKREMQNSKYMYLQSKNLKVELLAKDGVWSFSVEQRSYKIEDFTERELAYYILGEYNWWAIKDIVKSYNKDIKPPEIKDFIEYFKDSHPTTKVPFFNPREIMRYASFKNKMCVPCKNTKGVWFTLEQEDFLINLFSVPRKLDCEVVRAYLIKVMKDQNLIYGTKYITQDLAESFCRQHGMNYWKFQKEPLVNGPIGKIEIEEVKKEKSVIETILEIPIVYVVCMIAIMLMGLWGFIAIHGSIEFANDFVGTLAKMLAICVPLYLIARFFGYKGKWD